MEGVEGRTRRKGRDSKKAKQEGKGRECENVVEKGDRKGRSKGGEGKKKGDKRT